MEKIKVLIVDDHAIVRMGLAALLNTQPDMETVGEAKNGEVGVKAALRLKPDVIVMDILMPVKDGILATREIVTALPMSKVLILTTSTSADKLAAVLDAGATGVVTKTTSNASLLAAIRSVASGRRTVTREIEEIVAHNPPDPNLTEHQLEMLESIVRGLSNSDIARQFDISINTVRKATSAIFQKLNVANRTEAAAVALCRHLLERRKAD